jgi:hypothetical protein
VKTSSVASGLSIRRRIALKALRHSLRRVVSDDTAAESMQAGSKNKWNEILGIRRRWCKHLAFATWLKSVNLLDSGSSAMLD